MDFQDITHYHKPTPYLTVERRWPGSNISFGCLHSYTRLEVRKEVKDDSSEKIRFFHVSWKRFYFAKFVFGSCGILIVSLLWNSTLCSFRWAFLKIEAEFPILWLCSVVFWGSCTFMVLLTIHVRSVRRFLSESLGFLLVFCFDEDIFPVFQSLPLLSRHNLLMSLPYEHQNFDLYESPIHLPFQRLLITLFLMILKKEVFLQNLLSNNYE